MPRPVEGPLVFKDIHSDEYHIYVDHFSNHTLFAGRFTSLGYDHLIDWSDADKIASAGSGSAAWLGIACHKEGIRAACARRELINTIPNFGTIESHS